MIDRLRADLIEWGITNFKKYEWRTQRTPYSVFISEIMLQRTNARQVVPVYHEFISRYRDIESITQVPISCIKKIMKPLGLYWKAEKLYSAAAVVYEKFDGIIPDNKTELMDIPGIGDYTASAILCFGYSRPFPLIDTNTVRITGRIFNLETNDASRRSIKFKHKIMSMLDLQRPVTFNYAMLDLGISVCSAKKPLCNQCPLVDHCFYGSNILN